MYYFANESYIGTGKIFVTTYSLLLLNKQKTIEIKFLFYSLHSSSCRVGKIKPEPLNF